MTLPLLMRLRLLVRLEFVFLAGFLFLAGCGSSGKKEDATAPAGPGSLLPPSALTLTLDLSISDQAQDMDQANFRGLTTALGGNYFQAMVYVLVVNEALAKQLATPVALIKSEQSIAGVQTKENQWIFSSKYSGANRSWNANLTGTKVSDTAATWEMRVTTSPIDGNGCCDDFLFFDGQSSSSGSGSWQFYDLESPKVIEKLFALSYEVTSATQKTLLFSVNGSRVSTDRFGNGSSLKYTIANDLITLTLSDSSETGVRVISWNRSSKKGSHTDIQGNQVCWDSEDNNFSDISCE